MKPENKCEIRNNVNLTEKNKRKFKQKTNKKETMEI